MVANPSRMAQTVKSKHTKKISLQKATEGRKIVTLETFNVNATKANHFFDSAFEIFNLIGGSILADKDSSQKAAVSAVLVILITDEVVTLKRVVEILLSMKWNDNNDDKNEEVIEENPLTPRPLAETTRQPSESSNFREYKTPKHPHPPAETTGRQPSESSREFKDVKRNQGQDEDMSKNLFPESGTKLMEEYLSMIVNRMAGDDSRFENLYTNIIKIIGGFNDGQATTVLNYIISQPSNSTQDRRRIRDSTHRFLNVNGVIETWEQDHVRRFAWNLLVDATSRVNTMILPTIPKYCTFTLLKIIENKIGAPTMGGLQLEFTDQLQKLKMGEDESFGDFYTRYNNFLTKAADNGVFWNEPKSVAVMEEMVRRKFFMHPKVGVVMPDTHKEIGTYLRESQVAYEGNPLGWMNHIYDKWMYYHGQDAYDNNKIARRKNRQGRDEYGSARKAASNVGGDDRPVCINYAKDNTCSYGDNCRYRHVNASGEVANPMTEKQAKEREAYFQNRKGKNGKSKYSKDKGGNKACKVCQSTDHKFCCALCRAVEDHGIVSCPKLEKARKSCKSKAVEENMQMSSVLRESEDTSKKCEKMIHEPSESRVMSSDIVSSENDSNSEKEKLLRACIGQYVEALEEKPTSENKCDGFGAMQDEEFAAIAKKVLAKTPLSALDNISSLNNHLSSLESKELLSYSALIKTLLQENHNFDEVLVCNRALGKKSDGKLVYEVEADSGASNVLFSDPKLLDKATEVVPCSIAIFGYQRDDSSRRATKRCTLTLKFEGESTETNLPMTIKFQVKNCLFVASADDGILVAIKPITQLGTNVLFGNNYYDLLSVNQSHPSMRVNTYGSTYTSLVEICQTNADDAAVSHSALTAKHSIKRAKARKENGLGDRQP